MNDLDYEKSKIAVQYLLDRWKTRPSFGTLLFILEACNSDWKEIEDNYNKVIDALDEHGIVTDPELEKDDQSLDFYVEDNMELVKELLPSHKDLLELRAKLFNTTIEDEYYYLIQLAYYNDYDEYGLYQYAATIIQLRANCKLTLWMHSFKHTTEVIDGLNYHTYENETVQDMIDDLLIINSTETNYYPISNTDILMQLKPYLV